MKRWWHYHFYSFSVEGGASLATATEKFCRTTFPYVRVWTSKGLYSMAPLDILANSDVITIATVTATGNTITTPVGVVVVGDDAYVRSQRRAEAKWYQRALRHPAGYVVDGEGGRYPVAFEHVTDANTLRRVDAATYRKYGGPLRSLLLRPMLWWTRNYVVRISEPAVEHGVPM